MMFIFVFPSIYLAGSLLTIVGVSCLGSSFVLLNAFLPLLASNHPLVRGEPNERSMPLSMISVSIENDDMESLDGESAVDGLLGNGSQSSSHAQIDNVASALKLSNNISSKGVGIGYAAAVFVQLISIAIILLFSKFAPSSSASTLPMRCVLFVVGLWWALFTLPAALWLQPRPGPPLPVRLKSEKRRFVWIQYVAFAWLSLWKTIKTASKLRQVVIYLIAWFLLSDGVATMSGTAILFARTELKLGTAAVALLSITATASGIIGAACWPLIGRRFGLSSVSIIISCILIFEIIPLYGLLGFLPFIKALGVGGLQQWWEIYPLAFILGFVMGGISSYCRSVFGLLIPPGQEAAFYALFAVTDKGSSAIGPAVVGRIIDATGSIRMGFWFLSVVMIAPAPFFWFVDIEKGRSDAKVMAGKQKKRLAEHRRSF
jgi:UMF1 family MFS transporter